MKGRRERQDDQPGGLTHNPFAALRGGAPAPEPTKEDAPQPRAAESLEVGGRPVVRRERRGRGGKTVTRVEGLGLALPQLDELSKELKRALGCGASVEGEDLLLQGALVERAADWLQGRFGVDVRRGN